MSFGGIEGFADPPGGNEELAHWFAQIKAGLDRVGNKNITEVSASLTATFEHDVILVDATSGDIVVTMPPAQGRMGREFDVKKIDSSVNTVTLDGFGSDLIDGEAEFIIGTQNDSIRLISDNTDWWIL